MARPETTNSSRHYLRQCNIAFAADMTPGMRVLDAGAGSQPYYDIFSKFDYESADFEKVDKSYSPSTYVCDLKSIPVEEARFDRIVFNQVLEHIPDPLPVLRELHRVLKPGGAIICTCPLFYEEHEQPYDFYRYTQFAHRHLFTTAGFEIQSIDWMEGYFGTMAYQLRGIRRDLPLAPRLYTSSLGTVLTWPLALATKLAAGLAARAFTRLDIAAKVTDRGYPKNYVVIARKPD